MAARRIGTMVAGLGTFASASTLQAEANPVTKVVALIKDMYKQLEKEGKEDQEVYDKMMCWCETNDKEKTKSIADAEAHITDLKSKIEEYTALSSRLSSEIKSTEKEVAENQGALDAATEMRQKQIAEFQAEESDVTSSVSALKAALSVLGKHQELVQLSDDHKASIASAIEKQADTLTEQQREMATSFIQVVRGPASYAPQSGQIFGILDQMRETFEQNLAASQKEENENQKSYEELKDGKRDEITAGQEQIDAKTQELATSDEKHAAAKQDYDDTTSSLEADQEFLKTVKEKCAVAEQEFTERSQTRAAEMEACTKAQAILSSGHDLFTKTFSGAALVQVKATDHSQRREEASTMISAAAQRTHNSKLIALAARVKLDAMVEVKKAIDDMINALLQEKADEIKLKDYCNSEFNSNMAQTEKKDREKADLAAKVEDLTLQIKELTEAIDALSNEIREMKTQMQRAGEDREKENKDFNDIISDQRATQQLLKAALDVLGGAGKQKGGVIAMIQQIIDDAQAAEKDAIRAESDSQLAYESFVKDSNAGISAKSKTIDNKASEKAEAEQFLVDNQGAHDSAQQDLDTLAEAKTALHGECDFVLKNFEVRQTTRDEEVAALRQAKAILSGTKFIQFLARE